MKLSTPMTPFAIVDLTVVERNCRRMAAMATEANVALRPHVKTHKCVAAAKLATAGHFGGITVSTLAEAAHFKAAGFDDITYAVPIAPTKVNAALDLAQGMRRLNLIVDHAVAVRAIADAASARGVVQPVLLKVDCGYHRAGVEPHRPEAMAIVEQIVAAPSLAFEGLLTHAGHSYGCVGKEAIARVAAQERAVVVQFAEVLRARGIAVNTVSIGSTPTMSVGPDLSSVTEIRPGNYVFYDAFQAAIGSCSLEDAALSVVATVISAHPHDGRLILDAGALALSKDGGATLPGDDTSYGVVTSLEGQRLPFTLTSLSQEHGIVRGTPEAVARFEVGERLRVIANHSCLTAACHEELAIVRDREIIDSWRPVRGW